MTNSHSLGFPHLSTTSPPIGLSKQTGGSRQVAVAVQMGAYRPSDADQQSGIHFDGGEGEKSAKAIGEGFAGNRVGDPGAPGRGLHRKRNDRRNRDQIDIAQRTGGRPATSQTDCPELASSGGKPALHLRLNSHIPEGRRSRSAMFI